MPDVAVPAAPALSALRRVELIHTGQWKISSGQWNASREDLAAAVAALDCPAVRRPVLKLGHSKGETPLWAGNPTGQPAVGWVDNLATTNQGHTLVGDMVGMPGWLGDVAASAYPDRSVEGSYDHRCQAGHTHPFVLTAVALLGVTPPGVGTLRSLQDVATLYGVQAAGGGQMVVAHLRGEHNQEDHGNRGPGLPDLGVADKLKLAGRIRLGRGEQLTGSSRVGAGRSANYQNAAVLAKIATESGPRLRLGIVDAGHGRDDTRRWSAANRGGTVALDAAGIRSLREGLADVLAKGREHQQRYRAFYRDEGNPDADPGYDPDDTLLAGEVPSPWGDLVYELRGVDDEDGGWGASFAVRPQDAGAEWTPPEHLELDLSPAKVRQLVKELDGMAVAASAAVVAHLPGEHNQLSHGDRLGLDLPDVPDRVLRSLTRLVSDDNQPAAQELAAEVYQRGRREGAEDLLTDWWDGGDIDAEAVEWAVERGLPDPRDRSGDSRAAEEALIDRITALTGDENEAVDAFEDISDRAARDGLHDLLAQMWDAGVVTDDAVDFAVANYLGTSDPRRRRVRADAASDAEHLEGLTLGDSGVDLDLWGDGTVTLGWDDYTTRMAPAEAAGLVAAFNAVRGGETATAEVDTTPGGPLRLLRQQGGDVRLDVQDGPGPVSLSDDDAYDVQAQLVRWLGDGGEVEAHLPGRHDQRSHGRRFNIPGLPGSGLRMPNLVPRLAPDAPSRSRPRTTPPRQRRVRTGIARADPAGTTAALDTLLSQAGQVPGVDQPRGNTRSLTDTLRGIRSDVASGDVGPGEAMQQLSQLILRTDVSSNPRLGDAVNKAVGEIRDGRPAPTPPSVPDVPQAPSGTSVADRVAQLRSAATRDEARQALDGLTAARLRAVADELGVAYGSGWRKSRIADAIVQFTVGRRADFQSIERLGSGPGGGRGVAAAPVQVQAAADLRTGAMVALIPAEQELDRLAVDGGEDRDQLHMTLLHLGEADAYPAEVRQRLAAELRQVAEVIPPGEANGMAISAFNPQPGRDTAIVLELGGDGLEDVHGLVEAAVEEAVGAAGLVLPEQHAPWRPHVTLTYSDDLMQVARLADRAGPVRFDRLRLAFAGENVDIPLTGEGSDLDLDSLTDADMPAVDGDGQVVAQQSRRVTRSDRPLRRYWLRGKGAAKIRWGTGGDFTRCVRNLRKHVRDPKGLCATYHRAAVGFWPGDSRNASASTEEAIVLPNPNPTIVHAAAQVSVDDVRTAYYAQAPQQAWIREFHTSPKRLIVANDADGSVARVDFDIGDDGTVSFAQPVPVRVEYVEDADDREEVAASRMVYASRAESRPDVATNPPPPPGFQPGTVQAATVSDKPWSDFTQADYTPDQWRRACLIVIGDGETKDQCLAPWTPVPTKDGWKRAAEVDVGDLVLTTELSWCVVTERHVRQYRGALVGGGATWLTPEHPVLTENGWLAAGAVDPAQDGLYSLSQIGDRDGFERLLVEAQECVAALRSEGSELPVALNAVRPRVPVGAVGLHDDLGVGNPGVYDVPPHSVLSVVGDAEPVERSVQLDLDARRALDRLGSNPVPGAARSRAVLLPGGQGGDDGNFAATLKTWSHLSQPLAAGARHVALGAAVDSVPVSVLGNEGRPAGRASLVNRCVDTPYLPHENRRALPRARLGELARSSFGLLGEGGIADRARRLSGRLRSVLHCKIRAALRRASAGESVRAGAVPAGPKLHFADYARSRDGSSSHGGIPASGYDRVPYSGPVFNFEVAGHPSYFAGLLGVHNCKLPVREPDGTLNRNGVHAAAGGRGISRVEGISDELRRSVARKIVRLYRDELDEDPPESLLELAGTSTSAAAPTTDPQKTPAAEPGNPTIEEDDMPLSTEVYQRLGLAEDADEATVNAAVLALAEKADNAPDPQQVAAAAEENQTLQSKVEWLEGQVSTMSQEIAASKAEKNAEVKTGVLNAAQEQGKFHPHEREQWEQRYDKAPEAVTDILAAVAVGTAVPVNPLGKVGDPQDVAAGAPDEEPEYLFSKVPALSGASTEGDN